MQKLAFMGKNYEAASVPKQSGTGTTQQKLIGTGTDTSGTGTTYRMCSVPVPNRVVPIPHYPKCPDLCSFAYLSLNSYTVSMETLIND